MNGVDRLLQRKRIAQAIRWIPSDSNVLDVGCSDGALFRQTTSLIKSGIGIDTEQPSSWPTGPYSFRHGTFPEALGNDDRFDIVVMLAVIEHVSDEIRTTWASRVPKLLTQGGRLIITVPAPAVDRILDIGIRLRLLHGMDTANHHGFDPLVVPQEFSVSPMRLVEASRFEFGLNHLFVFERT
jgi:SAM-dependent methyltransferase